MVCSLTPKSMSEREALKYFSKEYLFDNQKVLFMKAMAQFKAFKEYRDWNVYYSTLFDSKRGLLLPWLRLLEQQ